MKNKVFLLVTLFSFLSFSVSAQEEAKKEEEKKVSPWKISGVVSLPFTQTSFTSWAAGGDNSFSMSYSSTINMKYQKNVHAWEAGLTTAYGLTFMKSERRKNDDRIDFYTKYGRRAFKHWNYATRLSFKSQFDKGYKNYPVTDKGNYASKFMSPAYVEYSIGMDYKPHNNLSVYISPLTFSGTIVLDSMIVERGDYGVPKGDWIRDEYGASSVITYRNEISEKTLLNTKLELFSNLKDNPENIRMNLQIDFDIKINKYFSAKFSAQFFYDDKAKIKDKDGNPKGPCLQVRQMSQIGLSYMF